MTTLLILLATLIVLFWVSIMLLWWKQKYDLEQKTVDRLALYHVEKIIRLGRRSYYASALYGKRALSFGNKTIAKVFVRAFPSASAAFKKHDTLAGLEHGPSSYFLHSISSSKAEVAKPKTRRKKIVA